MRAAFLSLIALERRDWPQKIRYQFKNVRDRKILHTEFFKVQYIIIQAILSRKSMKKFAVTDEKYSIRLLTVKNNLHADMRI